ncbi:hypothetical protein BDN72DRAFT_965491 [Pluteus cervinus]|uniref:Uncharacterized protein n=1 Tax=Pluteus cervinus TaxID=181527 RepID=A0ACD3A635_9AGAR|nr:hypothetical protein BDN72DRAFT_965491 [Pluteus cervinus]
MTSPAVPISIELAPSDDHYGLDDILLNSPEEFLPEYPNPYSKLSVSALFSLEQQALSPHTYDDGQNMIYSPASLQPPQFGWSPGSSTSEVSEWSWGSGDPSPHVLASSLVPSNITPELNGLDLLADYSPGMQICRDVFGQQDQYQTCNPQQTWYTDNGSNISAHPSLSPLPFSPHTALPHSIEPLASPVDSVPPSPDSSYGMPPPPYTEPYTRPNLRVNTRFISKGVVVPKQEVRRATSLTTRSVLNKRKIRDDDDNDDSYVPPTTRRQTSRQSYTSPSVDDRSPLPQSSPLVETWVFESDGQDSSLRDPALKHSYRNSVGSDRQCEAAKQRRTKAALFVCDLCSKDFTAKHNLDSHKKSHLGIKPFQCGNCEKRFTTSRAKNRHAKSGACERGSRREADYGAYRHTDKRFKHYQGKDQDESEEEDASDYESEEAD